MPEHYEAVRYKYKLRSIKETMSSDNSKVIGYIAKTSRINFICFEKDACLIAGSESSMRKHLAEKEGRKLFTTQIG